jgi:2-keto-4-pentenoate hydratase/2-oxohepta-3-ene-1,7-dioic acid hydratase in catechol pathway
MRHGTIADGHDGTVAVRLNGDGVAWPHIGVGALRSSMPEWGALAAVKGERRPPRRRQLHPARPHPNKITCLGLNYAAHINPGDVIATGTPGGVGFARDPKIFLRPGQVLTTVIEGLDSCENRCVAERAGVCSAESSARP